MTSAYDMALIAREAYSLPDFSRIVHAERWGFPGYPAAPAAGAPDPDAPPPTVPPTPVTRPDGTVLTSGFVVYNDNQLLYNYPGAIGGKTGFTDDARQTFVGAAERDGRRLVVVLLDGTRLPKAPWQQTAELLDAGFATARGRSIGALVAPSTPPPSPRAQAAGTPVSGSGGAPTRVGPTLAVGACVLLVVVGGALALRPRRRRR